MPEEDVHWQTRVVANKFPIVGPTHDDPSVDNGIYRSVGGRGRHEVIIETPLHNGDVALMSSRQVRNLIEAYHLRYSDALAEDATAAVFVFRNHGPKAGTSLVHPHSQLVATAVVPPQMRARVTSARNYFNRHGRCGYCDMVEFENAARQRIVLGNERFLAFVPFAAEAALETWIVPRQHRTDFGGISDVEKDDLAETLREILLRLRTKANDPDYNCIIHTAPKEKLDTPYLHWYIQIKPRTDVEAGFEIGSGMSVNTSWPEEDARILNGAVGEWSG
jgi:UDPglucose--hexose-1-phosphate uridylyltransferase